MTTKSNRRGRLTQRQFALLAVLARDRSRFVCRAQSPGGQFYRVCNHRGELMSTRYTFTGRTITTLTKAGLLERRDGWCPRPIKVAGLLPKSELVSWWITDAGAWRVTGGAA